MNFFLTGTRIYGPLTDESDWDIVMVKEDAQALRNLLNILRIELHKSDHIHPSYEGFYFKFNQHDKVQIIVAHDQVEYEAWKYATNEMKKIDSIDNRQDRISTFQSFFYEALSKIRRKYNEDKSKLFKA